VDRSSGAELRDILIGADDLDEELRRVHNENVQIRTIGIHSMLLLQIPTTVRVPLPITCEMVLVN